MGLVGWANSVQNKYAAQMAQLYGGRYANATFKVGDTGGSVANTLGNVITLNRDYFRQFRQSHGGARDFGAILHELGHAENAGAQYTTPGQQKRQEFIADATRYALSGTANGWTPSAGALAVDKRRDWGTVETSPGGTGHPVGAPVNNRPRNRNTVGNGAMPATPTPGQEISYGQQLGQNQYMYAQKLAAQRTVIANARAGLLTSNQQAQAGEIQNMAQNVENQIAAGGIGSSADAKMRSGLLSGLTTSQVSNRGAMVNTIQGARTAMSDAQNQMLQGQWEILAARQAAQLQAQKDAFASGSTLYGTPGGGGSGNGPYGPPPYRQQYPVPAQAGDQGQYVPGAGWRF